nr:alpha/beta fold hydrolase [Qipengyuania vesicularis]
MSAYGALPDVEDAAISPDGEMISMLLSSSGQRILLIVDSNLKPVNRLQVGDAKVRYMQWLGNERILLVTGQTEEVWGFTTDKIEVNVGHLLPIDNSLPVETIFGDSKDVLNALYGNYGLRQIDGRWVAHFGGLRLQRSAQSRSRYVFDHGRPFLYSIDVNTNRASKMSDSARQGYDRDWVVDAEGRIAATLDASGADGDWKIEGPTGKRIASGTALGASIGLIGLGSDGSTLLYAARRQDGINEWFEIPLAGGTPRPFLADTDVDRLYFHKVSGYLMGYLDADKGPVFFDQDDQKAAAGIRKAFDGYDFRMVDWTPDFTKVLVRTSGKLDSGTWFVVDLEQGKADAIAYERAAIGPERVGPVSTFAYKAGDGLDIDGILTLPPGREAKDLPLVMLPHGGPHSYDREKFDWWAQAFASRGYAVFQPNFRGSTNKTQAFKLAGFGEWGRAMQTDISDGLTALAEKGIVDPARVCIVGASYGGYAALAGVTIQQGIYRCAVAVAPVSDIRAMFNEDYRASGRERMTKEALLDQLGPKDRWDDVSPRRLADRADAPIMLIHGRDDTVVPYSHSTQMADKLKDNGKPYELVELEGEDHWLSLSKTRLRMLEAAVGFVEKHNPAD